MFLLNLIYLFISSIEQNYFTLNFIDYFIFTSYLNYFFKGTSNRISNNNNNSSNDHIMTISQTKPDSANKENNKKKSQNHNHVNETRITKTLAIIMSSFLFCWLPFFIIYVIRSFLDDPELIEPSVMDFFIWLGYFNSCLDPILYVILNENFRETLTSIITCKWSHLDRNMKRTKI